MEASLAPAAAAFDAIAEQFDNRYGGWLSVAAQRRAVRSELLRAFPAGSRVIEIGAGTGEDALWLMGHGRRVRMTDASPSMVRVAARKLDPHRGLEPLVLAAERIGELSDGPYDGAYSNFAALNCVTDLSAVARGLAALVRPGGQLALVLFGRVVPGEMLLQLARRELRLAFRRLARGEGAARLGGSHFSVTYHRGRDVERALTPWFRPTARRGIGVFVPPSAAEPSISRHPRLLSVLERIDRAVSRPLAMLGDHVLYRFERTTAAPPAGDV
jgi:ubiquinone/menaquinone biosynthesis C-methylase UbiE